MSGATREGQQGRPPRRPPTPTLRRAHDALLAAAADLLDVEWSLASARGAPMTRARALEAEPAARARYAEARRVYDALCADEPPPES